MARQKQEISRTLKRPSDKSTPKRLFQRETQDGHCTPCPFHQVSDSLRMDVRKLQKDDKEQDKQLKQIQGELSELHKRLSKLTDRATSVVPETGDKPGQSDPIINDEKEKRKQCIDATKEEESENQDIKDKHVTSPSVVQNKKEDETSVSRDPAPAASATASKGAAMNDTHDGKEPEVVRQTTRTTVPSLHWELAFSIEMEQAKMGPIRDLGGVHDVICLDISESMSRYGAWSQAKAFIQDYIKGLKQMQMDANMYQEHVALVTFGHVTKVEERLTNKFDNLLTKFEMLRLGGPSPLYGGMKMAVAAAGSSEHQVGFAGDMVVRTKLILITDGYFTEKDLIAGPDEVAKEDMEQAATETLDIFQEITRYNLDLIYVPVGKANMDFLQLVNAITDGKILSHTEGEKLSRQTYLTVVASNPQIGHLLHMLPVDTDTGELMASGLRGLDLSLIDSQPPSLRLSAQDMEEIKYIKKHNKVLLGEMRKGKPFLYKESNSEKYPPLGTRVRRGPDWETRDQDHFGVGTIVGHIEKDDRIWVEWDAEIDSQYHYRYGAGRYDVLPVNESRAPGDNGELLVGCVVKPTTNCRDTNIKPFDRGTILTCENENRVKVRWNNGILGNYNVRPAEKCEVEYSAPYEKQTQLSNASGELKSARKRNKNKNSV